MDGRDLCIEEPDPDISKRKPRQLPKSGQLPVLHRCLRTRQRPNGVVVVWSWSLSGPVTPGVGAG